MPTARYYPNVTKSTTAELVWDLVRFLVNALPGYTGPGWTIVSARDAGFGGTKVQTPTDPSDFDTFPADFCWRTGVFGLNEYDWIVLESAEGAYGTTMQVYLSVYNDNLRFQMLPLSNFPTSPADTTPPTNMPATAIGSGGGYGNEVLVVLYGSNARFSVIADEAVLILLADDTTDPKWIYIGELDGARSGGTPADDRPFVIYDYPGAVCRTTAAYWNRLSPVDDTTVLTSGGGLMLSNGSVSDIAASGADDAFLGLYSVWPYSLHFNDTGHKHFAGWLRYVGYASVSAPQSGTLASKTWLVRGEASDSRLCFEWDGTTDYP